MYVIGKDFFYDEVNDFIWHRLDEADKKQLPLTASRILCLFLQNQGKIMTREHIFDEIWVTYGVNASNNTLNQYISLIRKRFEQLGLNDEIIKTIPRTGFLMPEELEIELIGNNPPEKKSKPTAHTEKILYSLVLVISCSLVVYFYSVFFGSKDTNLFKVGTIGSCSVYMIYQNSSETRELKLRLAKQMAETYSPCIGNEVYIYHPSDSFIYDGQGSAFLTRCTYQNNNSKKYAGCYDVYEFPKK
ncbi:winged helix-turn-helix domain-containing protein [Pantoea agglomerans]|uniref:winged helix-turn-helix domain-containing protein n=1 Tax=Enterobacter agglomerans TaxID=549 RepID=UPI0013B5C586|nr:winged helix-turn-helix domain-containing protein [Pantoea agglomerans]NEG59930.1 hypothetical protein [Pantoea agglomerans]NEH00920.1 hypothetical protein [Pantoea agglomerans]NEH05095.1 hypothetical protein [Pantoea agglomerans]NEH16041.1 hypothetical protein [Pantoea agglomerans]